MPAIKDSKYRSVEIFRDKSGGHRFRVRARNGRVLASSQAYADRWGARKGAAALVRLLREADGTGNLLEREGGRCSRMNS